ncbi:MAG: flagellar motor switch protein FliG, partial [Rhizobiales bacterium]|nr:flagellar motor switch protein FliG [Hyphomicrobiales bacterium]
ARPPLRSVEEKVAILLLALGNPLGTKLLQSFDPRDLRAIMNSASTIGPVERDDLELLVDDFAAQFAKTLGINTSSDHIRSFVEQAFPPDQLNSLLGHGNRAAAEPVWRKFSEGSENALVPYLLDQHPQTTAFVLSNLESDLAARCLSMLPRELRDAAARRLLKLQPVKDVPAQHLRQCLEEDLLAKADLNLENEGRSRLASLMNKLEREQSAAIIESLAATWPEDAKRLRGMIFSFEDIDKLAQPARLALFDKIPTEQVIPALRGMPPDFKEAVLSSMGARARRMVEAELSNDSGQVGKEGQAARRAIADAALAMAQRGEILLPAAEDG